MDWLSTVAKITVTFSGIVYSTLYWLLNVSVGVMIVVGRANTNILSNLDQSFKVSKATVNKTLFPWANGVSLVNVITIHFETISPFTNADGSSLVPHQLLSAVIRAVT